MRRLLSQILAQCEFDGTTLLKVPSPCLAFVVLVIFIDEQLQELFRETSKVVANVKLVISLTFAEGPSKNC